MSIIDRLSAAQTSLLKRRQRARMASRDKPFKPKPPAKPRDVFAFIIHEGKVRAPHGAVALQKRVGG